MRKRTIKVKKTAGPLKDSDVRKAIRAVIAKRVNHKEENMEHYPASHEKKEEIAEARAEYMAAFRKYRDILDTDMQCSSSHHYNPDMGIMTCHQYIVTKWHALGDTATRHLLTEEK